MTISSGTQYKFRFGTAAQYASAKTGGTIVATDLYFLTDTKQIYVGEDLYSGSVEFVDGSFPQSPSQGIIYCNPTTHETKVWTGSAWNTLVPPVVSEIAAGTASTSLADVGAIKTYVSEQIGDAYTITKASTADTGYAATYQLFKGSTAVGDKINIPKDMVVESGSVKTATAADVTAEIYPGVAEGDLYIDLVIANADSSHIYIPVNSLVEFPTVADTNSIDMSISNGHEITADVRVSAATGNIISINSASGSEGIFAEHYIGSIDDTSTVDLTVTNKQLTAAVKVSANTGNAISAQSDGLYVATVDPLVKTVDDTSTIDLTVDGSGELTAAAIISSTSGNQLTTDAAGLYVAPQVWNTIAAS